MNPPPEIERWLRLAHMVPEDRFVSVGSPSDLDAKAFASSQGWARRFFATGADPHTAKDVRYSFHLADAQTIDILRYQWTAGSLSLEARETAGFTLLRIMKKRTPPISPADVDHTAHQVLNMEDEDHSWKLTYPSVLGEGAWFSTSPDSNPHATNSWGDRLDGDIHDGIVEFLCFKKHEQRVGLPGVQIYFGDEFRAAHGGTRP
jgi:hypothetical protein